MCTKSSTDREEPSRIIPNTATDDPSRRYDRRDRADPMCTKSKTASEDPKRDMPYTDTVLPIREKERKESVDPMHK